MSRCAFCGRQQSLGHHFFAHRADRHALQTVKVCDGCAHVARQAGYTVAQREPIEHWLLEEQGTTAP